MKRRGGRSPWRRGQSSGKTRDAAARVRRGRRWTPPLGFTGEDDGGSGVDFLDAKARSADTLAGGSPEMKTADSVPRRCGGPRVTGTPVDGALELLVLHVL
jgi:hypothetical protein